MEDPSLADAQGISGNRRGDQVLPIAFLPCLCPVRLEPSFLHVAGDGCLLLFRFQIKN
jgi:hypothetical protein